jgi:hypothetical protein
MPGSLTGEVGGFAHRAAGTMPELLSERDTGCTIVHAVDRRGRPRSGADAVEVVRGECLAHGQADGTQVVPEA